jgi:hypothetical protein
VNVGQKVKLISTTEIEACLSRYGWPSHSRRLVVGDAGVVTKETASDGLFEVSFCGELNNKWSPVVTILCNDVAGRGGK